MTDTSQKVTNQKTHTHKNTKQPSQKQSSNGVDLIIAHELGFIDHLSCEELWELIVGCLVPCKPIGKLWVATMLAEAGQLEATIEDCLLLFISAEWHFPLSGDQWKIFQKYIRRYIALLLKQLRPVDFLGVVGATPKRSFVDGP